MILLNCVKCTENKSYPVILHSFLTFEICHSDNASSFPYRMVCDITLFTKAPFFSLWVTGARQQDVKLNELTH